MAKLKKFSGKQVCKLLADHGFLETRRKGSHILMQKQDPLQGTISVPVPDHKELKPGTLSAIIRQSRLGREVFE